MFRFVLNDHPQPVMRELRNLSHSLLLCVFFWGYKGMVAQATPVNPDTLLAFARTQLGTNYCYASKEPGRGFDCSGFVYFVFDHFNILVPRSSRDYMSFGTTVSLDSAKAGDVIVFTGTNAKNRRAGHVGIIISGGSDSATFIHSSSGKKKGVIISDFNESPYYRKRFLKVVRIDGVSR